ncbi:MAG: hypothetical protein V8S08_06300 [Lachnoclostridium sp.]
MERYEGSETGDNSHMVLWLVLLFARRRSADGYGNLQKKEKV